MGKKATEELMKKKPMRGSRVLSRINGKPMKDTEPPPRPVHAMGVRG